MGPGGPPVQRVIVDETGPFESTGITATYTYHLRVGNYNRLSLGVMARTEQYRYDPTGEIAADPDDPLLGNDVGLQRSLR